MRFSPGTKRIWAAVGLVLAAGRTGRCAEDHVVRLEGRTFRIRAGAAYEVTDGGETFFTQLHDPGHVARSYTRRNGKIHRRADDGKDYAVYDFFKEGFEGAGSIRELIGPERGWGTFTLQSPKTPTVQSYVDLRRDILLGKRTFIDNRVEPSTRIAHGGNTSLRCLSQPPTRKMHTAKASLENPLMHFVRNDPFWFSGWYYIEKGFLGGLVVPGASEEGGVVTNGMSEYARCAVNSNSGLMVGVTPADFGGEGPLAGVEFQRKGERRAFELGGGHFRAPAQRVGDFLARRPTTRWGGVEPSYLPGATPADLWDCLPEKVCEGIKDFSHPDALLTGVETRSSSPVRMTRDEGLQSNLRGLYPVGEGAGYAGGIMSSAVDGLRAAEAILGACPA